ncbi:MAG: MotA/TolQ/ExbB proton channel family protein [Gemmataceae bacterium]
MSAFVKFVTHDWWIALPMFVMSIIGVALVIWRLLLNMNAGTNLNEFLPEVQSRLDKEGVEGALKFCRSRQDLIPRRLYVAGLEVAKQGLAASRRAMNNTIEWDILPELNTLLPSILAIAKVATMIGLLGTVISMIGTFEAIGKAAAEGAGAAQQAGSIGLALFATALGLVTAIPLVFSHVLFKAWQARFETKMRSSGQKLLLLLQTAKAPKSPPPPKPPTSDGPGRK